MLEKLFVSLVGVLFLGACGGSGLTEPATTPTEALVEQPRTAYFDSEAPVLSQGDYLERVADQVDPRHQQELIEDLRFRLRSQAVIPEFGADRVSPIRESWAIPLGIIERDGQPALAVATTRCVVDFSYPSGHAGGNYHNLALFTGAGRPSEVFRVSSPDTLPGSRVYDQRRHAWFYTGRYHLEGPPGERYFNDLATGRTPGVDAGLPIGSWDATRGVDIAVLYFPLADEAVGASLHPSENLGIEDPEEWLRELLLHRTQLFGSFNFSLVTNECMEALYDQVAQLEDDLESSHMLTLLVAVAAVAVVVPLVGSAAVASAAGPTIMSLVVDRIQSEALGAVWQTVTRTLAGEELRSVFWDEAGRLMLRVATDGVQEVALAGLTRAGLDEASAERIVRTVEGLVRGGDAKLSILSSGEERVATVVDTARQRDVSAELLRRGLVRLDLGATATLTQQPGLVSVAKAALTDPATRDQTAIASRPYQRALAAMPSGS